MCLEYKTGAAQPPRGNMIVSNLLRRNTFCQIYVFFHLITSSRHVLKLFTDANILRRRTERGLAQTPFPPVHMYIEV